MHANILVKTVKNALLDFRFGMRFLGGSKPSPFAHLGAYNTVNSDYELLPIVFKNRISPDDVLVDVGCGKGRVLNFWLSLGCMNKIYGLEIDEDIAKQTQQRLRKFKNVTIISGNALEHLPPDATVFYLYNPFSRRIMQQFQEKLYQQYKHKTIRLFYFRHDHLDVFNDGWDIEILPTYPTTAVLTKEIH